MSFPNTGSLKVRVTENEKLSLRKKFGAGAARLILSERTAFDRQSNDPFTGYTHFQFMRDSRTIGRV